MDIANPILVIGYRGVGKTFLLKKILNDQPDKFLTVYIDLSRTYGGQKGNLTEKEVIKEILTKVNGLISENDTIYKKIKNKISDFF